MKNILTSALLLVGVSMFAQTAQTKTTTTTTTQTTTTGLTAKAKALCTTWNLSQTENFGDIHQPTNEQKGDLLLLTDSGRYRLIMNGVAEGGTWTLSKDNLWITMTTDAGAIKKFKVLESTDKTLKVDYRDADDIHNILYYSTGTAPKSK
ncbi:MAG TPA: hypothetical protein VFI33_12945 [Puia sp.]|nr:hypothetical protein [Puia sp.]